MRMGRGLSGCLLPVFVAGGVFFALIFGGGAFVLAQLRGDAPSPLLFGAIGVGGALVFWGVAYAVHRGFHPRRDRSLAAAVDRVFVQRGDTVRIHLAAGGDGPDVELGLVCHVAYDTMHMSSGSDSGGPSRMTNRAIAFEQWVPATMGEAELTVPAGGPYSHEGQAVSFAWAAYARRAGERVHSAPTPIWVTP